MGVSTGLEERGRGRDTFGVLDAGDQVRFGESGDAFMDAAAAVEAGEGDDQRGWDDFVVLAALLDL